MRCAELPRRMRPSRPAVSPQSLPIPGSAAGATIAILAGLRRWPGKPQRARFADFLSAAFPTTMRGGRAHRARRVRGRRAGLRQNARVGRAFRVAGGTVWNRPRAHPRNHLHRESRERNEIQAGETLPAPAGTARESGARVVVHHRRILHASLERECDCRGIASRLQQYSISRARIVCGGSRRGGAGRVVFAENPSGIRPVDGGPGSFHRRSTAASWIWPTKSAGCVREHAFIAGLRDLPPGKRRRMLLGEVRELALAIQNELRDSKSSMDGQRSFCAASARAGYRLTTSDVLDQL